MTTVVSEMHLAVAVVGQEEPFVPAALADSASDGIVECVDDAAVRETEIAEIDIHDGRVMVKADALVSCRIVQRLGIGARAGRGLR